MGAMQGIWMAEQAMEKERLDQANLDLRTKSEDRLDAQFRESFTRNRLNDLSTSGFGFGNGSSLRNSKSGSGSNSLSLSAETENTLKKITNLLPEDSTIVPKLVNANLESLQNIVTTIEARQKTSATGGLPLSPDAIEAIFKDIYVTSSTSESSLNVEDLASYLQVDLESEYVGGVTWNEYLTKQISPKTVTSVQFSEDFPVGSMEIGEVKNIRGLFQSELLQQIDNELLQFADLVNQGTEVNQDRYARLRKAQTDLKLDTPTFGLATSLVGVDVLLDYVQNYPLMKQPNSKRLFNRGLTYNIKEDLDRAINMGFVIKGEKINWKGNFLIVTESMIAAARSTNP